MGNKLIILTVSIDGAFVSPLTFAINVKALRFPGCCAMTSQLLLA